jgi:hypothetical protein
MSGKEESWGRTCRSRNLRCPLILFNMSHFGVSCPWFCTSGGRQRCSSLPLSHSDVPHKSMHRCYAYPSGNAHKPFRKLAPHRRECLVCSKPHTRTLAHAFPSHAHCHSAPSTILSLPPPRVLLSPQNEEEIRPQGQPVEWQECFTAKRQLHLPTSFDHRRHNQL